MTRSKIIVLAAFIAVAVATKQEHEDVHAKLRSARGVKLAKGIWDRYGSIFPGIQEFGIHATIGSPGRHADLGFVAPGIYNGLPGYPIPLGGYGASGYPVPVGRIVVPRYNVAVGGFDGNILNGGHHHLINIDPNFVHYNHGHEGYGYRALPIRTSKYRGKIGSKKI